MGCFSDQKGLCMVAREKRIIKYLFYVQYDYPRSKTELSVGSPSHFPSAMLCRSDTDFLQELGQSGTRFARSLRSLSFLGLLGRRICSMVEEWADSMGY